LLPACRQAGIQLSYGTIGKLNIQAAKLQKKTKSFLLTFFHHCTEHEIPELNAGEIRETVSLVAIKLSNPFNLLILQRDRYYEDSSKTEYFHWIGQP
jgi:hypothetical protein